MTETNNAMSPALKEAKQSLRDAFNRLEQQFQNRMTQAQESASGGDEEALLKQLSHEQETIKTLKHERREARERIDSLINELQTTLKKAS